MSSMLRGIVLVAFAVAGTVFFAASQTGCGESVVAEVPESDGASSEDSGVGGKEDSGKPVDEDTGAGPDVSDTDAGTGDVGSSDDTGVSDDSGTGGDGSTGADGGTDGGTTDGGTTGDGAYDAGPDVGGMDGGTTDAAGSDSGTADAGSDGGSGTYHPNGWAAPSAHGAEAKKGLSACTACHGADLSGGAGPSCNTCHSGWKTNCTFCHGGTDNQTGAPPVDTTGKSATTEVTVGAHTSHVEAAAAISTALDCVTCHIKPADALAPGHVDGAPAEITWGSLAKTGSVNPAWDANGAKCSATYCHGNFTGGTAANSPTWTKVDGTQAKCGTCHELPPKTGRHPTNYAKHSFMQKDCTNCHNGIANNTATAIADPSVHVNGVKDVRLKNNGTWNSTNKTCDPMCHGSEKW